MILEMIEGEYRVTFDTDTNNYLVHDKENNVVKETSSSEALKKYLSGEEAQTKERQEKKKAFTPIKIIKKEYNGGWLDGVITSFCEETWNQRSYAWVTTTGRNRKERQKENMQYLILDIAENRSIAKEIDIKERERKNIEEEISSFQAKFIMADTLIQKVNK